MQERRIHGGVYSGQQAAYQPTTNPNDSSQQRRETSTPGWVSNNFNSVANSHNGSIRHVVVHQTPATHQIYTPSRNETSFQSNDVPQKTVYFTTPGNQQDGYFEEVFQQKRAQHAQEYNVYGQMNPRPTIPPQTPLLQTPVRENNELNTRNSLVREVYNPLKTQYSGSRNASVESGQKHFKIDNGSIRKIETPVAQQSQPPQPSVNEQSILNLKNQMQAMFKERENLQAENQRLKIANQGLLKDTDFLKSERAKLEDQLAQSSAEKDAVYQRRITDLNRTVNSLYQQNKVLTDKADESIAASKSTRDINFELENQIFELKKEMTTLADQNRTMSSELAYLRKSDQDSKAKITELKDLLLEADEKIFSLEQNGVLYSKQQEELSRLREQQTISDKRINELKQIADVATIKAEKLTEELSKKERLLDEFRRNAAEAESSRDEKETLAARLKNENERLQLTMVSMSAYNQLKNQYESVTRELENVKLLIEETRHSEETARQNLNDFRRKYQTDIEQAQRTNQSTHSEYKAQVDRLKETIRTLEEQNRVLRIETEHNEQTVASLRAEREQFGLYKVTQESKVTAAERTRQNLESEVAQLQKALAEAKQMSELDMKYKMTETKRLAELKVENMNIKKELLDTKAKLLVANVKQGAEARNAQKTDKSLSLLSLADTSMNDGDSALHRECRRKIRNLQNDYVELQNENMKLRDDVYRLREEKIDIMDRSIRLSKARDSRKTDEPYGDKDKSKEDLLDNSQLSAIKRNFLKSPVRGLGDVSGDVKLFDNEDPLELLREVKKRLQTMLSNWEKAHGSTDKQQSNTVKRMLSKVEEAMAEIASKVEEQKQMHSAIEEANLMIAKLECDKKVLLEELRDIQQSASNVSD